MAYETLKAAIRAAIYNNGNEEITGDVLQGVLLSIVNTVGAGATFGGVATPETNPGTPEHPVFWLGAKGNYSNFGTPAVEVRSGYLAVFQWDGSAFNRTVMKIGGSGGAFDVTDYTGNSYTNVSEAAAAVPVAERAGGMNIKYVDSSNSKYVQYSYMGTSTADADFLNLNNWEVDSIDNILAFFRPSENIDNSNIWSFLKAGFVTSSGSFGTASGYNIYKLDVSEILSKGTVKLTLNTAGSAPLAVIFDATDSVLGYVAKPSTEIGSFISEVDLTLYPDASYVLYNTYELGDSYVLNQKVNGYVLQRYPDYVPNQIASKIVSDINRLVPIILNDALDLNLLVEGNNIGGEVVEVIDNRLVNNSGNLIGNGFFKVVKITNIQQNELYFVNTVYSSYSSSIPNIVGIDSTGNVITKFDSNTVGEGVYSGVFTNVDGKVSIVYINVYKENQSQFYVGTSKSSNAKWINSLIKNDKLLITDYFNILYDGAVNIERLSVGENANGEFVEIIEGKLIGSKGQLINYGDFNVAKITNIKDCIYYFNTPYAYGSSLANIIALDSSGEVLTNFDSRTVGAGIYSGIFFKVNNLNAVYINIFKNQQASSFYVGTYNSKSQQLNNWLDNTIKAINLTSDFYKPKPSILFVDSNAQTNNYDTFKTLKEVTEYISANSLMFKTVYVKRGTYDLTEEYPILETYTHGSNENLPCLRVGNNTHFIFEEGTKVICNNSGDSADAVNYCSAFNVYGSCTLENLDVEVTNMRYCIHDDLPTAKTVSSSDQGHTVKYINCKMKHNGNPVNPGPNSPICIGGGCFRNSVHIIIGGEYSVQQSLAYAISYHNYNLSSFPGNSQASKVVVKDAVVKGLRLGVFGDSLVEAFFCNNFMDNSIKCDGNNFDTYFTLKEWNNIV